MTEKGVEGHHHLDRVKDAKEERAKREREREGELRRGKEL